ncbi:LuxR C-terminal-related transcriptional regulator, partial [Escherichia coli]|uniref:LuxR C-terminal-related transcriptional regulator n=3 Tax=Gammaproteobacteria TaxID=1236 RepID=UPI0039BE8F99
MDSVIQIGAWKGSTGALLAERELACLLSLASGMTDKEIARRDGLSPRSIKGRLE